MTAPEVTWTLEQIGSVISAIDEPLKRIDRDESLVYDGDGTAPDMTESIRERTEELRKANFVGAHLADRSPTPIGTEYDHTIEAVVGLRIEGLHESEWGHVDPEGIDGIAFDDLVRRIRRAILASRGFPDAGDTHTSYTDLQFANEADTSDDWADYYRYDLDVVFSGFEELP